MGTLHYIKFLFQFLSDIKQKGYGIKMVYITGDMHGDETRLYDKEWHKLKKSDILIVCGDFGFMWDGSDREKSTLNYLGSRKFTVCFLDGTHENYDLLKRCRETIWKGGKVHRIKGNLFHLMRGQIFNIDGIKLFTFGGGESTDKDMRIEQNKWWRAELPSPSEMAAGASRLDEENCTVDYILTHEPPSLVKSAMLLRTGMIDRVNKLNGFLEEVGRTCTYRHWYFGSLHEDRVVTPKHSCVFKKMVPLDMSPALVYQPLISSPDMAELSPLETEQPTALQQPVVIEQSPNQSR